MTNVFISWSGETSKSIAEELRKWIPSTLQFVKPYFTPDDIEKGSKWGSEIAQNLSNANVGIICLTRENLSRPWILFEAGALSKNIDESKVCSLLFGIEPSDLVGPLSTFQTTQFAKSDFKKMMSTINGSGGDQALSSDTFNDVFDMWWPNLEAKVSQIMQKESKSESSELRSERELLEEILLISRRRLREPSKHGYFVPDRFVRDLIDVSDRFISHNSVDENEEIQGYLRELLELTHHLASWSENPVELIKRIEHMNSMNESFVPF